MIVLQEVQQPLVPVGSTLRNLHSLATAVAARSPVLLEGPVGSGKTSLVDHLARITGCTQGSTLMKIQLGDQTDSKVSRLVFDHPRIKGSLTGQPKVIH